MISKYFSIFQESHNSFEGQQEGEKVVLILRRHSFVILTPLAVIALAAVLPPLFWPSFTERLSEANLLSAFWFVVCIWELMCWLGGFYFITMYMLNTVVVTDKRLIDNEQNGLFERRVDELYIRTVQDISAHTSGFIRTMLHFGNVEIQTASADKQFVFLDIPNPEDVKNTIMQMVNEDHARTEPKQNPEPVNNFS